MAAEQRGTRTTETRETGQRNTEWRPPELLPEPNAREGLIHRWIRSSLVGKSDNANVSSQIRAGWELCLASDYPELMVMPDRGSQFVGNIEVGGLLLCKAPRELMESRRVYHEKLTDTQMQSVDNSFLKENDKRMPLFTERQSKVTFGTGRK